MPEFSGRPAYYCSSLFIALGFQILSGVKDASEGIGPDICCGKHCQLH